MANALFIAPDALTLSNACWVQWVVREAGRILLWSGRSALVGIAAHMQINFPVHW